MLRTAVDLDGFLFSDIKEIKKKNFKRSGI
jgi:hypothetical protein